jgi:hypothetical protein|tara:strand:+ start:11623 stop:12642 length:1020 start_codon:yes stop_codon:yes gene_type:complete
MFEYFYNEILRRTIIGFGTLFNSIEIQQEESVIRIPLAYGPTQKFLARIEQSPDLNKPMAITLPRMSFEFTGLTYDPSRKVSTTQTFVAKDKDNGTETKKTFMPVPYNMQFELSIYTKLNDDALQIVEQILPYFQPSYNLTIELVDQIREKRDVPIVLESVTMQDDYEGDFSSRRVLFYTLRFTAKTYLFGPSSSASKDIIKRSTVSYLTGTDTSNTRREITYSATARALKSYTDNVVTTLAADITATAKTIQVEDATGIKADKYIFIGDEELFVRSKTGNKLTVDRGRDNTKAEKHVAGAEVKGIDYTETSTPTYGPIGADSALIEDGDNFGFDGGFV